jgi:predicted SnoaL-like aldol condensation-catalyzing enzyme
MVVLCLQLKIMKKMFLSVSLLALSLISHGQTNGLTKKEIIKMTNKQKATAVNKAVQKPDSNTINQLVREDYIQHTPPIPDGRKGLLGLLSKIERNEMPAPIIKNVRIFEDGDFVVLHHDVQWPNRKAMIEIFRFRTALQQNTGVE